MHKFLTVYKRVNKSLILTLIVSLALFSCVTDIDVNEPDTSDRLIFDAEIEISGVDSIDRVQVIYIYHMGGFDRNIRPVEGAEVVVSDQEGNEFIFTMNEELDAYVCTHFFASDLGGSEYKLKVEVAGEEYVASEKRLPTPTIDSVVLLSSRSKNADYHINSYKIFFEDEVNESNRYMLTGLVNGKEFVRTSGDDSFTDVKGVFDDRFETESNVSVIYIGDYYLLGDTVSFKLEQISEPFFRYFNILTSQTYQGSPFSPAPATVRGNVVNITDPKHYPLGYFKVNETQFIEVGVFDE